MMNCAVLYIFLFSAKCVRFDPIEEDEGESPQYQTSSSEDGNFVVDSLNDSYIQASDHVPS